MQTCVARASAAIVQHVPAKAAEDFKRWQRGVTEAAESFAGYEGSDLYPPSDSAGDEWVAVIHFEDDQSLQAWLDSPVRAKWIETLQGCVDNFEVKRLSGGFSQWFPAGKRSPQRTPGWKMALTVLCGLYPTAMLLSTLVGPYTQRFGLAFSMLVANVLSVSILQWLVMPGLNTVLGPWLQARERRQAALNWAGLVGIVTVILAIAIVFRVAIG